MLAQRAADPFSAPVVLSIQIACRDEALDLSRDRAWVYGTLHILNALLRFFAFDAQSWIQRLQVDFESLLYFEVGHGHGVVDTLLFGLVPSRLLNLANHFTALFGQVDADGEELCNVDVCVVLQAISRVLGIGTKISHRVVC